jgi:hypothetical protein
LAGTDHAKSRRNTETLLSSSDDDVDSPVIEADLLGGYGADAVENDLFGAAKVRGCRATTPFPIMANKLTKVSGETALTVSPIILALERTPVEVSTGNGGNTVKHVTGLESESGTHHESTSTLCTCPF